MKASLTLFVFLFSLIFTPFANAGLIINGGFEDTFVKNGTWRWFTSNKVDGWDGSNIEIWDSLTKFESYEGEQHAELNAHGSRGAFSIFQTFSTALDKGYDVSFAYAARRKNSESFLFEVIDSSSIGSNNVIFSQVMDEHTVNNWSTFGTSFKAQSDQTMIRFTTINRGTVGNFLDDVNVVASRLTSSSIQAVSEPSTLVLSSLLIAGLVLFRIKRA